MTASQVLRLHYAGCRDSARDYAWTIGLKHIMPTVTRPGEASDSWEEIPSEQQPSLYNSKHSNLHHNGGTQHSYNRLTQLRYLTWPGIPRKVSELLAHKFPKITVNPRAGTLPEQADPSIAVDAAWILSVAPFWEQDMQQVCLSDDSDPAVHGMMLCLTCMLLMTSSSISSTVL